MKDSVKKNQFLNLFQNNNFVKFMMGQLVSKVGDTVFMLGLVWLILDKTNSPKLMGLVLFFTYLPQFIFGLVAGSIVDHFDRRKIMIISDIIRGVILLLFCIIIKFNYFSIYLIYALSFLLASTSIFFGPASLAFIPSIVEKDLMVSANALNSGVNEICKITGNAIAGIIIASIGVLSLFIFDSFSFFFSALMLSLIITTISTKKLNGTEEKLNINKIMLDVKVGLKYIFKDSFIKTFILLLVISNISYGIVFTLTPIFSDRVLHAGPKGYGYLEAVLAIGMLSGISFIGSLRIKKVGYMFITGILFAGLFLFVFGFNSSLVISLILYLLFGASDAFTSPMFAYFRLYVNDEIRGRVFSVFNLIALSTVPISMAMVGFLTEHFGASTIYIWCGIGLIISAILAYSSKTFRNANMDNIK